MFDNLNAEQKKAVLCTEGPLLILAGAGSGKTRVITRRIAYLVKEKGIDPYSILAITFTNKAAKEMKERVEQLLGHKTEGMVISTFHSACVRILRREIQFLGYSQNFVIYDTADSTALLRTILKDFELPEAQYNPKSLLAVFGDLKDTMTDPEDYAINRAITRYEQNLGRVYAEYQKRLKKNNALDFDDIIFLTVKILKSNTNALEFYRNRFRYILVDEYQDTNKLQFALIELLSGRHRNLCVVGDDDQSIFMWRGADIRNILSFEKTYPGTNVVRLEQNYRSTGNILAAANDVIRHNAGRKAKTLWTDRGDGEKLRVRLLATEYQESRFVAEEIERLVSSGRFRFSDFAVLYRMNAQSRNFEDAFIAKSIPYRVFGSLEFYKRKEVKDVLAYLKLIYNEFDSVSFERAVSIPKRGIGPGALSKLASVSAETGISLLAAAQQADETKFGAAQRKALTAFAKEMNSLRTLSLTAKPSELITSVIENTGIIDEYMRAEPHEFETRSENIRELVTIAIQYENDGVLTLQEFLENMSLVSDTETDEGKGDYVSVMTLHSSKGLEFPVVFITGFEEGIFPGEKSIFEPAELEEERRLCYVGMTRAQDLLYLTCAGSRTIFGKTRNSMISRFYSSIQPSRTDAGVPEGDAPRKVLRPQTPVSGTAVFNVGEKVIHKRFGIGWITDISTDGADTILEIDFEAKGKRRLIEAYANLEKM